MNAKALSVALRLFQEGIVNVIETVANPDGQKGGTGITFGDPELHMLTETHENSFPVLARAYERSIQAYLTENQGRHPAYNAMRQWAQLPLTREMLRTFGARIVFVPRQKNVEDKTVSYIGVDMPMGDLTLLYRNYPSRMFQFVGPAGRELLIHDMKKKENLSLALRSILSQLEDPHVLAAVRRKFLAVRRLLSKKANTRVQYIRRRVRSFKKPIDFWAQSHKSKRHAYYHRRNFIGRRGGCGRGICGTVEQSGRFAEAIRRRRDQFGEERIVARGHSNSIAGFFK